jgi:hypothetical protein
MRTGPRFAHGFRRYDYIQKICRKQAEDIQDDGNERVRSIG